MQKNTPLERCIMKCDAKIGGARLWLALSVMLLAVHQLIVAVDCDLVQHQYEATGGILHRSDASLASPMRRAKNQSHQLSAYPERLVVEARRATHPASSLDSLSAREDASSRYANRASGSSIRRTRRFAGRPKTGRIMLAQRPPKPTTSSTSSTTRAPEEPQKSKAGGESGDEESSDSGDYEEIEDSSKPVKSSTGVPESSESVEEGAAEAEEEASSSSTTTQRTTTTTRRTGGVRKGTRNRPTTRAPSSSSSTSSSEESKDEEEEEEEKDKEEKVDREAKQGARKKAKTNEVAVGGGGKNGSIDSSNEPLQHHNHHRKKPLVALPFIKPKNISICTPEAYLEFPRDLIGDKWRARGLILVHMFVVCYMFYALAVVCERYFMPSLEEFAQRLDISEDVAGATLMSAGSSAPELFTAILGVFVAKGDVGTGAIVGSAVFNILFVIGVCAFVSTTTAQLQWWPVLRDSVYYTFTVLVLILIIYDERITALESASMIALYGVYIAIMAHNEQLKELVTRQLLSHPVSAKLISSQSIAVEGPDDVFGGAQPLNQLGQRAKPSTSGTTMHNKRVEDDSIWLAALLLVVRHKRLFRGQLRFQSAARYIITKRQHKQARQLEASRERGKQHEEVNYFGPEGEPAEGAPLGAGSQSAQRARIEAYARSSNLSKNKFSIVSKEDYEFWQRPPEEGDNYYLWLAKIPVNYVLHYTIPDCTLYPDKYAFTFVISIIWTAFFSYIMVWMVTIIGYTLGIPDSVMGVTFLAAGTSVPDCYSSIHAARNGMADMAVSNSIGSNVFDILIGLSVPWFIQSAIYPGVVATVNSRGVIYSVILLFLSLVVTIYLMNRSDWNLQPRLGLALIIAYAVFIILTSMLEFNLFGHVNPPPCPAAPGTNY